MYFIDPVEGLKKIEGDAYKPNASTPLYNAMDMGITKLINLITDEGLDLKFIDKASGLAMSDELSFYTTQTTENKKGKLVNPHTYIVTSRTDGVLPELFRVNKLSAKWSVVLRPLATGGTEIEAVLANIEA